MTRQSAYAVVVHNRRGANRVLRATIATTKTAARRRFRDMWEPAIIGQSLCHFMAARGYRLARIDLHIQPEVNP